MFTLPQIKAAHAQVKNGADFPAYIRDLILLGVKKYETYVADGHTDYFGDDDYRVASPTSYPPLTIATTTDPALFANQLRAHQQGNTDYPTFCKDSANAGVEKWIVDTGRMTCTYYDRAGEVVLEESIPPV